MFCLSKFAIALKMGETSFYFVLPLIQKKPTISFLVFSIISFHAALEALEKGAVTATRRNSANFEPGVLFQFGFVNTRAKLCEQK